MNVRGREKVGRKDVDYQSGAQGLAARVSLPHLSFLSHLCLSCRVKGPGGSLILPFDLSLAAVRAFQVPQW